jgi:hypothetical protein
VCFGANSEGTLEVSLQGGNTRLPSSLITSLCTRLLSCVDSRSFSFSYALNLV